MKEFIKYNIVFIYIILVLILFLAVNVNIRDRKIEELEKKVNSLEKEKEYILIGINEEWVQQENP